MNYRDCVVEMRFKVPVDDRLDTNSVSGIVALQLEELFKPWNGHFKTPELHEIDVKMRKKR
jgi:hypothetical protein